MAENRNGLEEIIRNSFSTLSSSEQKIAGYILDNYEDAAFMNISQLARAIQLSETTLSRFARHLGFGGYADFQETIQNMLRQRLTPREKIERTVDKLDVNSFTLAQALSKDAEQIARSLPDVNEEAFQRASKLISQAGRVYLAGLGISRCIVDFLEFRLRRCALAVEKCDSPGGSFLEHLGGIGSNDILIAVGFFRLYPELLLALEWCGEQGVPSVAITESVASPLGSRALVALSAKRGSVGELNSLVLPMAVANALAVNVALIRRREAIDNAGKMDRLQQIWRSLLADEGRR